MTTPTILIPGIKGTTLVNTNTLDFDTIWSGIQSKHETIYDLALKEDPSFDAMPRAIVERSDVEDLAYREAYFIIREKLKSPVYIFGYDWRKSCAENGEALRRYVAHLSAKLGVPRFNFLTHSTGGLVFSCYLKLLDGAFDVIHHAILTVCPFVGAVNALIGLIKGEGGIKFPLLNDNDEFRKIARTFPAVYELCPLYPEAVVYAKDHPKAGTPFEIYDPDNWQSNLAPSAMVRRRLEELRHFRITRPAMQDLSQLPEDVRARVLILAGVGEETKTGVLVEAEGPRGRVQNFFNFDAKEEGAGDGTVPLQSAAFFKDSIQTLKVDSKWYDKATHAFFLNDGRVQTIIKRFFRDETSSWCWWSDAGGTVDQM